MGPAVPRVCPSPSQPSHSAGGQRSQLRLGCVRGGSWWLQPSLRGPTSRFKQKAQQKGGGGAPPPSPKSLTKQSPTEANCPLELKKARWSHRMRRPPVEADPRPPRAVSDHLLVWRLVLWPPSSVLLESVGFMYLFLFNAAGVCPETLWPPRQTELVTPVLNSVQS